MLLVYLPFFCLCTGNVKVDDVTCLGEGKGGGSPILSKLDLGCCPGLKKIAGNMGVDAEGVCHPAIDGGFVCAKCGDGKCGIGENKCNCPSDCSAACAEEGEGVFDNPGMGPVKCCDVDAGIKPLTRIDTTYNICSDPDRSGSKGICSKSWAKTCGNGVCDSGEDKCNCLKDCPPPDCAKDGEQVYLRSIDGPVRCCSVDSGIKYDHRLENGACTAVSGQFSPVGACVVGWQKTCGDGACGSGENRCNCPQDCDKVAASCGNGKCEAGETTTNCLTDCPCVAEGRRMPTFAVSPEGFEQQRQTGNLECCPGLNSVSNQFYNGVCEGIVGVSGGDVCVKCGNGVCGSGENYCNCPKDCASEPEVICGNAKCEAGESTANCSTDCPCIREGERTPIYSVGSKESHKSGKFECCPELVMVSGHKELDDHGICQDLIGISGGAYCTRCGDGRCGRGENICNCLQDCENRLENPLGRQCNTTSDCAVGINLSVCCSCPKVIPRTSIDGNLSVVYVDGTDYSNKRPPGCKYAVCSPCRAINGSMCRRGLCFEPWDPSYCGNGVCEPYENVIDCPFDCRSTPFCGNGFCEAGENQTNCLRDCNNPVCYNEICEKTAGENATNCPADCEINSVCGNLACEEDENKVTCPQDCADHT